MEKQRHGFVTFWLWLMLVGNGISVLICVYTMFTVVSDLTIYYGIVSGIVNCISAYLLFNWKKLGFWLFCGMAAMCYVVNIFLLQPLYPMWKAILIAALTAGLSVLVPWAILQIKKEGVSCWSLLE